MNQYQESISYIIEFFSDPSISNVFLDYPTMKIGDHVISDVVIEYLTDLQVINNSYKFNHTAYSSIRNSIVYGKTSSSLDSIRILERGEYFDFWKDRKEILNVDSKVVLTLDSTFDEILEPTFTETFFLVLFNFSFTNLDEFRIYLIDEFSKEGSISAIMRMQEIDDMVAFIKNERMIWT